MRRAAAILALTVLAACQGGPAVVARKPPPATATSPVKGEAPSPSPSPISGEVAARPVGASPNPSPTPAGKLQRPTTPVVELAGKVQVDPGYLVSQGAGKVIANNGANILAIGDQALAAAEGNLIANNAASIISDNGGGILSNNGGSLTSKVKRKLLQEADDAPLIPAAGMAVGLRSLRSGQALPIGVDGAGNPVYAIYTNQSGAYQLFVPAEEAGNVLVVANPPGQKDQRYDLVAATGSQAVVDDDSSVSTQLLREAAIRRWVLYLTTDPTRVLCLIDDSDTVPAAFKPVLQESLTAIYTHAKAHGVTADPALGAAVYALAERCADRVLAGTDLQGITFGDLASRLNVAPTDGVLAFEDGLLSDIRRAVAKQLRKNPTFFDTQPYMVEANACDPGRYAIRKPTDLSTFLTTEYIANLSDPSLQRTQIVLASISTDARGKKQAKQLGVVVDALTNALAAAYVVSAHGEMDAVLGLIDAFDPAHPLQTAGEPPYVSRVPCPRASKVPEDDKCN